MTRHSLWVNFKPAYRLLCLLPAAIGLLLFCSTGRDDSHITYWPAYTLKEFGEIVNYNGERVEQSSSLLLVIWLACLAKLFPLSIPTLACLSSILMGVLAVYAAQRYVVSCDMNSCFFVGLECGTMVCLVYWAFSGMEATLAAVLALCVIHTFSRFLTETPNPRLLLGVVATTWLTILVRPENVFVLLAALSGLLGLLTLHIVLQRGSAELPLTSAALRRNAVLLIITLVLAAAMVALRMFYFGRAFPEPVYAKSQGFSLDQLTHGLKYLREHAFSWASAPVWLPALFGCVYSVFDLGLYGKAVIHRTLPSLLLLSYLAFVALSGGDWMEGGRFLVPVLPIAVIVGVLTLQRFLAGTPMTAIVVAIALLQISSAYVFAKTQSQGIPLWEHVSRVQVQPRPTYSWFERSRRVHQREVDMLEHLDMWVTRIRQTSALSHRKCPI